MYKSELNLRSLTPFEQEIIKLLRRILENLEAIVAGRTE
jgi:hypothetical protein